MVFKNKKAWLKNIGFYGFLVLCVSVIFLIRVGNSGAPISIFGVSFHNVLTSSMEDTIPQGSLVITYRVDPKDLQIGDDITYMRSEKVSITHRIVGIIERYEDTGERAFETKGTMNKEQDTYPVPAVNVVGKVVFHNHTLGVITQILKQYWIYIVIMIGLLYGLVLSIKNIFKQDEEEGSNENDDTVEEKA